MPKIEFITTFVKDPFINGAKAILNSVRNMAESIQKSGADINDLFRKITDGGQTEALKRKAQQIAEVYSSLVEKIGLSGDVADGAKEKINKALNDMANSTEKPKEKFRKFAEEMSSIMNGIRLDVTPIGNINSTSSIASIEKRLKLESNILDVLEEQKAVAEKTLNHNAEGFRRNKENLSILEENLNKKYNGAAESFYSEEDLKKLNAARETVDMWAVAWDNSNTAVQTCNALIDETGERTEKAKQAVDALNNVYKGFADTVETSSNKIFISEDVFLRYNELKGIIIDLKEQIRDIGSKDEIDVTKLNGLQDQLTSAQEEFRALDGAARHTAEILGADLAGKTSKALEKLYDLNSTVRYASKKVEEFEQKLNEAKKELAEAKDPAAITAAKQKVDELSVSLDKARDDLSKFKAEQKDAVADIQGMSKKISGTAGVEDGVEIAKEVDSQVKSIVGNIAAIAGIGLGLGEIKDFFNQAKEWRMYFQDIESSFKVFLGSAEKGTEFTEKLQKYAYYNMFEFSDLAAASQQMISYGHDVESIIPRLDQLSNVATGTHGSLMELVDAYNRAKATGVVDARGIQSWAVKGVMIRDVLSDLGEVTAGTTITFEQLNKVLDSVTGEGGQFHNLMGEMMSNVSAEAGQLEDNLSLMFNEVGTQYEEVFVKFLKLQGEIVDNYRDIGGGLLDAGVEAATYALDKLAENWRTIVEVIKGAIVAYGTFKAAMLVHSASVAAGTAITKMATIAQEMNAGASYKQASAIAKATIQGDLETASKIRGSVALNANTVEKETNTAATVTLSNAMKGLTATMLANPYVLAATAIAGIAYACYHAYEGIMTQEKAQRLLTSAAEEYTERLNEQKQAANNNIAVIQNKTASLMAQTKAYRDLISEHEIFAKFSKEEIANMDAEQIQGLHEEEIAKKEEEEYRKRIELIEKLQEYYKGATGAWLHDPSRRIDQFMKELEMDDEGYAEKLKGSYNSSTNLTRWLAELKENADTELQKYLSKEAEAGVVEGIEKGISNDSLKGDVTKLLSDYGNEISKKTAEQEKALAEARSRLSRIESGEEKFDSSVDRSAALRSTKEQIEAISKSLVKARTEIGETFGKTFAEKAEQAKEEVEKLDHAVASATGQKKTELQFQLKQSRDEYNTLLSVLKLVEAGKTDAEVVLNVTRQVDNTVLGDEKLVEIGEGYKKIDELGQKFTNDWAKAKEEMDAVGNGGKKTAEEITEAWNKSSEVVLTSLGKTETELSKNIEDLKAEQDGLKKKFGETYKDTEEYRKLEVEITRKKEQLKYLQNLKGELLKIAKKPFSIWIDIKTKISDTVKGLLKNVMSEDAYKKLFGDEKTKKTVSETSQNEGAEAKARIDEKKKKGKDKKPGAQWKAEGASTAAKKAKEIAARRAKEIADELKYQEDLANLQQKANDARTEANVAAIKKDYDREMAERKAQHEKRLRDISAQQDDIYKKLYQQRKADYENANKDKKYENTPEGKLGWKGLKDAKLAEKELALVKAVNDKIKAETDKENADYVRQIEKRYKEEEKIALDFAKKWGDIEQQRLAIIKEYEDKIREARTPTEAAGYMLQRDEELKKLKNENIFDSIDWNGVFNDLKGHTQEYLVGLRNQLQDLLTGGKVTDLTQMATIQEKIREINDAINEEGGLFKYANEQQREHVRRIQEANDAQEALNKAKTEEALAQMRVNVAIQDVKDFLQSIGKDVNDSDINDNLLSQFDANSEEAKKLTEMLIRLKKAQADYNAAGTQTKKRLYEWKKAEDASEESLRDSIARVAGNINDWVQTYLGDLPELLNSIGLGSAGEKVSQGLQGVNDAAGAAADFAQGNYVGAALKAVSAVQSFGRALGIGGGNAAKINKELNRLNERNERLIRSIDALTEAMNDEIGAGVIRQYNKLSELQEELVKNLQQQIRLQMKYHSAHGSFNSYWEGFSNEELAQFNKRNNLKENEAWNGDLSNLTPELAKMLIADADMMEKIEKTGNGGYGERVAEKIRELAEQEGVAAEQADRLREALIGVSEDAMFDSFLSSLYDVADGVKDVTKSVEEDWQKMINHMLIRNVIGEELKERLSKWYNEYSDEIKAAEDDDRLSEDERARRIAAINEYYRKQYNGMYQEGLDKVQRFKDMQVINEVRSSQEQSATANSISNISYDQADSIVGIVTAIQMAQEQGNEIRNLVLQNIQALNDVVTPNVTEIRSLIFEGNNTRETMLKVMKKHYENFDTKINRLIEKIENQ